MSENRNATGPGRSTVNGTTAAGIGQIVTAAILSNNPELIVVAPLIGTAVTGGLSGVGNLARTILHEEDSKHVAERSLWRRTLGALFGWIG